MNALTQPTIHTRFYRHLLAQAVGDAFGYVVEFDSFDSIRMKHGPLGLRWGSQNLPWIVSDDTQMTVFCLEAVVDAEHKKLDADARLVRIFESYKNWFTTQKNNFNPSHRLHPSILMQQPSLYARRAPGNTCLSALSSGVMGTISAPINTSKGCGGIMRTSPCALFTQSTDEAFELGSWQAAITHGHPSGYLSAGFYTSMVYTLLRQDKPNFQIAFEESLRILTTWKGHEETLAICQRAARALEKNESLFGPKLTDELGEGWVGEEALAVALYCAARTNSFADCIERSTNHSGDSDSTAMLAVGLWSLLHPDELPYVPYSASLDVAPVLDMCALWLGTPSV